MVGSRQPGAIAIIATLDTKGPEAAFVADQIRSFGYSALVLDTGILGGNDPAALAADFTPDEIAAAAGEDRAWLAQHRAEPGIRARAVAAMARGSELILLRLWEEGRLAGVIGLGGAQGTEMATQAMRGLPFGVPKLMVSAVASGRTPFGMFTGTRDLTIMHSVVDILGLNSLSRRILANAAGAIAGMARAKVDDVSSGQRRVGITIYGNTTPAGLLLAQLLTGAGYEVIAFHPSGTGGVAMEQLAVEGRLDALLDLTTHEITDQLFGGLHAGDGRRLRLAAKARIPRLVVPGCVDFMVFAGREAVPAPLRRQTSVSHNPHLVLVRCNKQQLRKVGREMASRLNLSNGPLAVVVPTRGWSFYNRPGLAFEDSEADESFLEELRTALRPDIPVHTIDAHINDPDFVEAAFHLFREVDAAGVQSHLDATAMAANGG